MAPDRITHENITWIVGEHERRLQQLDDRTADIAVIRNELKAAREDIRSTRGEISSIRRALYTFAFSIAAGAILFAFTVFQVIK